MTLHVLDWEIADGDFWWLQRMTFAEYEDAVAKYQELVVLPRNKVIISDNIDEAIRSYTINSDDDLYNMLIELQ